MEMQDFKDLSNFVYDEYEKLSDSFGLDKLPKRSIKFIERSLRKYTKLYDKPLFLLEKRRLKLQIALETMPHGFLWKIFHLKLWKEMQYVLQEQQKKENEVKKTYEENVKPVISVPAVIIEQSAEIVETTENNGFDANF